MISGQKNLTTDKQLLSLSQLCESCKLHSETIREMVEYGVASPLNARLSPEQWSFTADNVLHIHIAMRLCRDLDVNIAGAALAIDLLEEIKELREQYLDS